MKIRLVQVSETALMVYFGDKIETSLPQQIARFDQIITTQLGAAITDAIPSYTSLLLEYNPLKITIEQLMTTAQLVVSQFVQPHLIQEPATIVLPVYYGLEVSPDLVSVARQHNLSTAQVITIHSQRDYTVCAIGFAPGFAFLGSVDPRIATPRHRKPRLKIPAGSVGIADQQSAVYPNDSPGGWQIIGNCPRQLFDPTGDPIMPFKVGDKVRFKPIDIEKYQSLGGKLCLDWK